MSTAAASPSISQEDQARADAYALLSRLFYAAPDAALLTQLRGPEKKEGPLELALVDLPATGYPKALGALQEAAREYDAEALRIEYDELFVGAGRAVVTPYTSGYAVPNAPDRYLVALREQLAAWGLVRRDAVYEVEDHVSAVCDVMRWLIEHDRPVEVQMRFFDEFVFRGVETFCDAIEASAATTFYRAVAGFARSFLSIESEAFALHTGE
jgi:TorA maturation chaperone TorD